MKTKASISPFESAFLKLDRAHEHFEEAKLHIQAYLGSSPKPYKILYDYDTETEDIVFRLYERSSIPKRIPLIVGDAIHNLRSALDHVAYVICFKKFWMAPASKPQFPICEFESSVRSETLKVCKAGSSEFNYITSLNVKTEWYYKILWSLHRLDIHDKHNLLISTFFQNLSTNELTITHPDSALDVPLVGEEKTARSSFYGRLLEDGDVIHRVPYTKIRMGEADTSPEFEIDVAFVEPKEVRGWGVSNFLLAAYSCVEDIVSEFEVMY